MRNKTFFNSLILLLSFLFASILSIAQEDATEIIEPSIMFSTVKKTDNSRDLVARLVYKGDNGLNFIENLQVTFYYINKEEEVKLADGITNTDGFAKLRLHPDYKIASNDTGCMNFLVRFEGNKEYALAEQNIIVKDIFLKMTLEDIDSVKTITISAMQLSGKDTVNVSAVDIGFYVSRMFSNMKIGDGSFEDGKATFEFNKLIVGDSNGIISIIAKITENEVYGDVECQQEINWGIPMHLHKRDTVSRELWTPIAPLWMIFTLIIMLAGVWGHYIFTIIQLVKINKEGKHS